MLKTSDMFPDLYTRAAERPAAVQPANAETLAQLEEHLHTPPPDGAQEHTPMCPKCSSLLSRLK